MRATRGPTVDELREEALAILLARNPVPWMCPWRQRADAFVLLMYLNGLPAAVGEG